MNVHFRPAVVRRLPMLMAALAVAATVAGSSAAAPSDPADALVFHTVPAARVLDTRHAIGVEVAAPLGADATMDLEVPGLPDDATAIVVNVTVVHGTSTSYLAVSPTGGDRPATSSINWDAAGAIGNAATVQLGTDQSVSIYNQAGTVDVIIDLLGYYAPGGVAGEGPMGPEGPAGVEGPMGPAGSPGLGAGPAGFVYLAASNSSAQTIHRGAVAGNALTFDSLDQATGGLLMEPSAPGVQIAQDGVYRIEFSVMADEPAQLDVRVNGLQPEGVAVFGADAGRPIVGVIVLALQGGDVVTLENWSSTGVTVDDEPLIVGDVTLTTTAGGTVAAVNAWITIEQLNSNS